MMLALIRDAQGRPVIDDPKMVQTFYHAKIRRAKKNPDGTPVFNERGELVVEQAPMMSDADKAYLRSRFPKELAHERNP